MGTVLVSHSPQDQNRKKEIKRKMSLLAIPLKVTGDVDLVKPIKTLISSLRSPSSRETNSLTELQALRNKMVLNVKNRNYSEAAQRDMENYFDQIGNLESKIPFSQVKIYFKWLDSFDKGSWISGSIQYTMSTNLLFEKACVLYNIAALATQIGATQDLNFEDSMKKAVRLYQQAAGILEAISVPTSSSPTEQKPTPDLLPESAAALASITLAQAQEIVLRKAVIDNKKNIVIAKLAEKTGDLYEKCQELMQVESVKSLFGPDWVSAVSAKCSLYSGLAQLHLAKDCKEKKQIGEEISRLEIAQGKLNKSKLVATAEIKAELLPMLETVENNLKDAKKDNDFIYFEKVPSAEELPPIEGALVVKPTPFTEKFLLEETNLFSDMPVFDPTAKKSECIIS